MTQTIVNLTLPIVTDKIDDILATYPLYEFLLFLNCAKS